MSDDEVFETSDEGRAFLAFMQDVRARLGELQVEDVFGFFQDSFHDGDTAEEAVREFLFEVRQ